MNPATALMGALALFPGVGRRETDSQQHGSAQERQNSEPDGSHGYDLALPGTV
jgi:hypothetical protein